MLGETLTFNNGGSGGTAKVVSRINQDNYSAEYLLRSSTDEWRVRIRHAREGVKAGIQPVERHNIELTQTVFATPSTLQVVRQAYLVLRVQVGDDPALAVDVGQALTFFLTETNFTKLAGWES